MKFAPHIGLSSPEDFMFPALAKSATPIDQIEFIAERGFSGIEDNFLKLRPVEVQEKIGKELAKHNLEMGCFVNNLIFDRPTFVSNSSEAKEVLLQHSTPRPIIPPPRYKMEIVTWLAIFGLIVIINLLFGSFLASLTMLMRSFVLTVGLVVLMTYVVMPRMTRLFSGWLYPKRHLVRSNG